MSCRVFLSLVLGGLLACSAAPTVQPVSSGQTPLSVSVLYAKLFSSTNKANFLVNLPALRARSVAAYYRDLMQSADDAAVVVAGYQFVGLKQRLRARLPSIEAVARTYPTLGEFWDAAGTDLQTWPTEAAFRSALKSAFGREGPSEEALGLVEAEGCPSGYDILNPPLAQALTIDAPFIIDHDAFGQSYTMKTGPGSVGGAYIDALEQALASGDTRLEGGVPFLRYKDTPNFVITKRRDGPRGSDVGLPAGHVDTYRVTETAPNQIHYGLGYIRLHNHPAQGKAVVSCYYPPLLPENRIPPAD